MNRIQNLTVKDIVSVLDTFAPPRLAMQGDRIGLQVGRLDKPVQKVWFALDASPTVIAAAIQSQVDMLVTHHAMLYRPVQQINTATARGRALASALAADMTVYSIHTNLDITFGGVNDVLAERLGLLDVEVLDASMSERMFKLVVYVPSSHQDVVFQAVCDAGAGHIGNYSHCTFQSAGTGTFLPQSGAEPFIGQVGALEYVSECRLETVVPETLLSKVTRSMLDAHPYEEVAYDIYPVEQTGRTFGLGRVGRVSVPMDLRSFAAFTKEALGLDHIRFSGNPDLFVNRVAVLGGAGGKWVKQAISAGAQVFVTSDVDHHTVADAWDDGLAIIDATHAALEKPVLARLRDVVHAAFPDSLELEVAPGTEDPFQWI